MWQQRKRLSWALGRRTSLRICLARWQTHLLQTAAIAEAFRVSLKCAVVTVISDIRALTLFTCPVRLLGTHPNSLLADKSCCYCYSHGIPRTEPTLGCIKSAYKCACSVSWVGVLYGVQLVCAPAQSVQVKRLALVTLQRWYQLVLYKREMYPQMLSSYLQAWAAYAHRLPLLRFLLLEQMATKQVCSCTYCTLLQCC